MRLYSAIRLGVYSVIAGWRRLFGRVRVELAGDCGSVHILVISCGLWVDAPICRAMNCCMKTDTRTKRDILHFLKTGQMNVSELASRYARDRATIWRWATIAQIDLDKAREEHCNRLVRRREMSYRRASPHKSRPSDSI